MTIAEIIAKNKGMSVKNQGIVLINKEGDTYYVD